GLWTVKLHQRITAFAEGPSVSSVAFSPDGCTLAVGDDGGRVGLWSVPAGRRGPVLSEPSSAATLIERNPTTVSFGPGEILVAGGNVGDVGSVNTSNRRLLG